MLAVTMIVAFAHNHLDYRIYATPHYTVLLGKFCACCALHLMIYIEVLQSMEYMKYICNHLEHFSHPGTAFFVALTAHTINLLSEVTSLYLLMWFETIEYSFVYFFGLAILFELPQFYTDSLISD